MYSSLTWLGPMLNCCNGCNVVSMALSTLLAWAASAIRPVTTISLSMCIVPNVAARYGIKNIRIIMANVIIYYVSYNR